MTVADTHASTSNGHGTGSPDIQFLNTVEGEITFFRSLMRARPVGVHRFFHVLAIRNAIYKDTNRIVSVEAIWEKLRGCWNLEALEIADAEHENLYAPSKNAVPIPIPPPTSTDNLANHPFFRQEFHLPYDEDIEGIVSQRRLRSTASAPSTPGAPSSPSPVTPVAPASATKRAPTSSGKGKKRERPGKSQSKLAGLVGGDSDSSALTQESGDEGGPEPETPRESVLTGGTATDAATESGGDEGTEMREPSPRSVSPNTKPSRGRGGKTSKRGRGRGTTTTTTTRSTGKRKR